MSFYENTLRKCLQKGTLSLQDKVLVVGGGALDKQTFLNLGFNDVLISNLDKHEHYDNYAPYKWERQDTESLSFADDSFDWVFTHAVLHHCASPHKALCEMLRVSSKGIGVFEARDCFLMNAGIKLGLVPVYELEPSFYSDGQYGGYRNSCVPNYIYRWTEKEIIKTVSTYLPHYEHTYEFFYGLRMPTNRLSFSPSVTKRAAGKIAGVVLPIFRFFFKKQCNNFGFIVSKKGKLQVWLSKSSNEYAFNMEYGRKIFKPKEAIAS